MARKITRTEILNPSGHIIKLDTSVLAYHIARMMAALEFADSLYAFAGDLAALHARKAAHEALRAS